GVYGELLLAAARRLHVRGGLRADVYSVDEAVRLSPRVALSLLVADGTVLTLSAGKYGQYVLRPVALFEAGLDDDADAFTVAESTHALVSLDQSLGDAITLNIEGFYKTFDGLPEESGKT